MKVWLQTTGYQHFRIEQKTVLMGEPDKDRLFNLCILIGKRLIHVYQNRDKKYPYSGVHFEKILELERETEEIFAIQNDQLEVYKYKWERYITHHQL